MVIKDRVKMSKSKGNVVSPDEMISRYGADAARAYSLFAAPPDRDLDWQEDGVAGVSRFLGKVYRLVMKYAADVKADTSAPDYAHLKAPGPALLRKLHQTISKVTQDFAGRWHFNTSIARHHGTGERTECGRCSARQWYCAGARALCVARQPGAADCTLCALPRSRVMEQLGHEQGILRHPWPVYDAELAKEDELEFPVQVNGKLKAVIKVPIDSQREQIEHIVLSDAKVKAAIAGKQMIKLIVVPGKLLNILVK